MERMQYVKTDTKGKIEYQRGGAKFCVSDKDRALFESIVGARISNNRFANLTERVAGNKELTTGVVAPDGRVYTVHFKDSSQRGDSKKTYTISNILESTLPADLEPVTVKQDLIAVSEHFHGTLEGIHSRLLRGGVDATDFANFVDVFLGEYADQITVNTNGSHFKVKTNTTQPVSFNIWKPHGFDGPVYKNTRGIGKAIEAMMNICYIRP
ncbi:MAG: hypothetical protein LBJ75_02875 [Puniceicoccales bacterium]|jgi:hypothetical protein|nr:hypothetical protein [Puniceicoccales bacterium]